MDATTKDTRTRDAGLWLTLLLAAMVLLNYVDRGAVGIAAPKLKDELMLSAAAFGVVVSAFSWIYAPAQFAVGWLSDRFCVYRMIAAGLCVWAVATLLTGFANGFAMLVALRVMLGIGEGVAFPSASKIIARHVTAERRGLANGVVAVSLYWGPALGIFAGGLILRYFGWRPIFFTFGSITLLWIVPWLLVSRPQWRRYAHGSGRDVPVSRIMRNRTVWLMGIGHFFNTYGFYFLLAWLPLFLVKERGIPILEMTGMITVAYIVQGFSAFGWGWLSDRLVKGGWDEGRLRIGLMSGYHLAAAASILGIGFSSTSSMILTWLVFGALFGGIGGAHVYAIAQIYAGPRAAGTWVGVMNGVGNTSGILGPVITGLLIQQTASYASAFVVSAAIVAIGALWWWFVLPRVEQIALD